MKPAEIEVNGVYADGKGGRRRVVRIAPHSDFPSDPLTVSYELISGRGSGSPWHGEASVPVYKCWITSFARWAKQRDSA